MAAGGKYDIALTNGQTISVWQLASQAVNSNPACTMEGAAAATTLTADFTPRSNCYIEDVVVAATLTAGGIEFYNVRSGVRSGRGINNLETYVSGNTTRRPPRIGLTGGTTYRLIQTVAGNA
jgi:hypothetical protein